MGTAIKHPVPELVKPLFVIFDIRALWRSAHSNSGRQKVNNMSITYAHVYWCGRVLRR